MRYCGKVSQSAARRQNEKTHAPTARSGNILPRQNQNIFPAPLLKSSLILRIVNNVFSARRPCLFLAAVCFFILLF
jgi:hypothetical protein